ncbi:MAG: hypothetical protein AAFY28_20515 [Actinomycetota bacterium]
MSASASATAGSVVGEGPVAGSVGAGVVGLGVAGDDGVGDEFTCPWNDLGGTDPFTTSATHTAPDTTGTAQTYTGSSTVDLLGRTVATTDPWGTTTVTNIAVDPHTGVRTTTATVTTTGGFTMTDTVTVNADGTTASMVRDDGTTTLTTTYSYNAGSTVNSITLTNGSTEIVTETRDYDTTIGIRDTSTWTQGTTTLATDTLVDAPNAIRVLEEALTVDGVTYTWDYTYGGLSRLHRRHHHHQLHEVDQLPDHRKNHHRQRRRDDDPLQQQRTHPQHQR